MIIYKYDGTIDGIFTCIFKSFTKKEIPQIVTDDNLQISLCDTIRTIETDHIANKRIITALYNYIGYNALCDIRYAFRSGNENKATIIFNYIYRTFELKKNISGKFSEQIVMDFFDLIKKVGNEAHRMKGFLRFCQCKDDIYYARFSPDNDIADLVLPHFVARFKSMPFVIHDITRNKVAMYNGKESKVVIVDNPFFIPVSQEEKSFQLLWCTYYHSVNIEERKNERLMRSFMPVRYYKNMVEKRVNL